MERLTEKELYDGKVCFTKCAKTKCPDKCADCDVLKNAMTRLKEYEDLEEQNKLLILPCAVGDTVYVIPSKTNYRMNILSGRSKNNRVYEQVVNNINMSDHGYFLETCKGTSCVIERFYKETWFLTKPEVEAALKKMAGSGR